MLTISQLARRFGLSRSTLLYYDSIGLLEPTTGGDGEYRRYSEQDAERLQQICTFREAGLRLKAIKRLLESAGKESPTALAGALERRLEEINGEIAGLQRQQRVIVGLLQRPELLEGAGVMNKETWVSLLDASGFSAEDMRRWHVEFERNAPEKHERFLAFLGLSAGEVEQIRSWSAKSGEEVAA